MAQPKIRFFDHVEQTGHGPGGRNLGFDGGQIGRVGLGIGRVIGMDCDAGQEEGILGGIRLIFGDWASP
jgi:hypothetical protein